MTNSIFKSWSNGLNRLGSLQNNSKDQLESSLMTFNKYLNDEKLSKFDRAIPKVNPSIKKWENRYVRTPLIVRAIGYALKFEFAYIKHQQFDINSAKYAFDYAYLSISAAIYQTHLKTIRYKDAEGFTIDFGQVRYIALGFLIGQEQQALSLLKIYLQAYNKNWVYYKKYPLYCLTINILADHYQLPRVEIPDKTNNKALVTELLQHWQTSDISKLNELLIQLCDLHTHKIKTDTFKIRFLHEFDDKLFGYFAFEYFLIRKLRAAQGLALPEIEHPLVSTDMSLDITIEHTEHDDLYIPVWDKLKSDGLDIDTAIKETLQE